MPESPATGGRASVLVIEADKGHLELVRHTLAEAGFDVLGTGRGEEGLEIAVRHRPDLILLEVRLPGMDGLEVCRRVRRDDRTRRIPVIMLSGLRGELDRVVGLELGADDYVTKPFRARELVARIRALLRRVSGATEPCEILGCGGLVLDRGRREVTHRGALVTVTATEFRILECLLSRPGRVLSRSDILRWIHEDDVAVTDRTVDVHVGSIRRKLGGGSELLETLRGFGYRLRDEREPAGPPRSGGSPDPAVRGWGAGRRPGRKLSPA